MTTQREICLICWNIPMELMAKLIYGKLNQYEMELILARMGEYHAHN